MYDSDKRKLLSALSHGAIFFSASVVAVGLPIALLLVSDDPVVKDNAKEALNCQINVFVYGAILGFLAFITLGLLSPLFGIWFLWHGGMSIWAVITCLGNPDQPFRYPFIFRVL
jgi:hypothetical protein